MTKEKIVEVLTKYRELLLEKGCCAQRLELHTIDRGRQADHILWMCEESLRLIETHSMEKACRWLGFIQGVLWSLGIRQIDELRRDNMPDGEAFKPRF